MSILLILLQYLLDPGIFEGHSHVFDPGTFGWYPLYPLHTGRRQLHHPMSAKHKPTLKQPLKKGKKKTADPNYGYEPYWENGELKLKPKPKLTGKHKACGEECHDLFIEYGKVCGRGKNYTHKTFDNYCQLLNQDCSGREKWMIAYRGPCQEVELKTYPTRRDRFISRADKYINDFVSNNPSTFKHRIMTKPTRKRKPP